MNYKINPAHLFLISKKAVNLDLTLLFDPSVLTLLFVNSNGHFLSEGQILFHGGIWPGGEFDEFITDKPLSTTFCPQVALRNSEHKGKAYDANKIDLLVLHAIEPTTKVFAYRRAGTNMGHENEVLFAANAKLTLTSRNLISNDYTVFKCDNYGRTIKKQVEIFVLTVNIS